MTNIFYFVLFVKIALAASRHVVLHPERPYLLLVRADEALELRASVQRANFSHVLLHVNAMHPVCLSRDSRPCSALDAFKGTDVGYEDLVLSSRSEMAWFLESASKQMVFVKLKGYRKAPLVGACAGHRPTGPLLRANPGLRLDRSHSAYDAVSFNFSSIYKSDLARDIVSCADDAVRSAVTYELYAVPWNQRYAKSQPSFNSSSLTGLLGALNRSSTTKLFDNGILLSSFKMTSQYQLPYLRISKRIGLDVVIAVAARSNFDASEDAFYVAHNAWGCSDGQKSCVLLYSLFLKIAAGVFALAGLLFAHLGRRFHALNTFVSGYILGFIASYILLNRFTSLEWEAVLAISLTVCSLGLAAITCGIFWRAERKSRASYLPLYVNTSFLIVSSLFFTSIGNQSPWANEAVFVGTFYGLVAFLSVLIFPWVTELIAVDLCTALVGCFLFVSGAAAIFLPGVVFPFVLSDALNRVAVSGNHGAFSVYVNSYVDFAVCAAWPLLSLLFAVVNHYCSPAFSPPTRLPVQPPPQQTVDWPPLPPDAFNSERVGERARLLPDPRPPASAPPPYSHFEEEPPAYRP